MNNCIHHWLCAAPSGPVTPARCTKCGAERTFTTPDTFATKEEWNTGLFVRRPREYTTGEGR